MRNYTGEERVRLDGVFTLFGIACDKDCMSSVYRKVRLENEQERAYCDDSEEHQALIKEVSGEETTDQIEWNQAMSKEGRLQEEEDSDLDGEDPMIILERQLAEARQNGKWQWTTV